MRIYFHKENISPIRYARMESPRKPGTSKRIFRPLPTTKPVAKPDRIAAIQRQKFKDLKSLESFEGKINGFQLSLDGF